jgi:hypothetical protein
VILIANILARFLYLVLRVVYENVVYGRVLLLLLRRTKITVYIFFKSDFDLTLNRSSSVRKQQNRTVQGVCSVSFQLVEQSVPFVP